MRLKCNMRGERRRIQRLGKCKRGDGRFQKGIGEEKRKLNDIESKE